MNDKQPLLHNRTIFCVHLDSFELIECIETVNYSGKGLMSDCEKDKCLLTLYMNISYNIKYMELSP